MNPRRKPKRLFMPKLPDMIFLRSLANRSALLLATANPKILHWRSQADALPKGR